MIVYVVNFVNGSQPWWQVGVWRVFPYKGGWSIVGLPKH